MTDICIVRHGETLWNREARLQGSKDIPLSETGMEQACIAADHLSKETWDIIYSSDLTRARDTAEQLNKCLHVPLYLDPGLRERNYGPLEGLTRSEIDQLYPDAMSKLQNLKIPGVETFEELSIRMKNTVESIALKHDQKRILIITHGGAINAFLYAITGKKPELIGNTSITRVRYEKPDWYVDCVNDCSHLIQN